MDDIKYDLSEVSEKWWTDVEVIGVFRRRLYDFVQRIRFSNFDKILVVRFVWGRKRRGKGRGEEGGEME